MVLTNFECWAHGESGAAADAVNFETGRSARNPSAVDPFSARVVSHIATASNGYYGYAIVNNNEAVASDNNNNSCDNNNMQAMQINDAADSGVGVDAAAGGGTARCKKRCFMMGHEQLDMEMDNLTAVKRCRFDDADLVAQYCNDFFSLPATQMIGTQACLMDYDYDVQQQQQDQHHLHHHQQQQQQHQMQHPRIQQHYQDFRQHVHEDHQQLSDINHIQLDDKCDSKLFAESADLYISTHGGCLHHYKPLTLCRSHKTDEEFDI